MKKQLAALAVLAVLALFVTTACNKTSSGVTVNVTGVSPTHGNSGTPVTITGTGFNPDFNIDSVSFGFITGKVISATATQIVVIVPPNPDSAKLDSVPVLVAIQGALVGAGYFKYDIIAGPPNAVSTFAGSGSPGSADGTGLAATFNSPENGIFDNKGNMFVADFGNNEIREISPAGVVTTFAGSTQAGFVNGKGTAARFNNPSGLAFDTQGNLYVSDELNNAIRKIDPSGNVTTFAGTGSIGVANGPRLSATFQRPIGLCMDSIGGNLIIADSRNNMIREINISTGMVSTLAGQIGFGAVDGGADVASFNSPRGVSIYATGTAGNENSYVIVSDYTNNKIREISTNSSNLSIVTTLAGNANGASGFAAGPPATFNNPNCTALGYEKSNGLLELFVADASNHAIRYCQNYDPSSSQGADLLVPTLAGTTIPGLVNGSYTAARFHYPDGIAYNPADGNLYVIEFGNNDIRKIILQ